MPSLLETFTANPTFSRIRRNHGLEHATIHVLSQKDKRRSVAGHSDAGGFWLFGDLSTKEVQAATNEALGRLRSGEHRLAIHPNCGTNLVTSGLMAGMAGVVAMTGAGSRTRDRLGRLPLAGLLATLALIVARPLGTRVQQRITTSGEPGNLEIVDIQLSTRQGLQAHRVTTRG